MVQVRLLEALLKRGAYAVGGHGELILQVPVGFGLAGTTKQFTCHRLQALSDFALGRSKPIQPWREFFQMVCDCAGLRWSYFYAVVGACGV